MLNAILGINPAPPSYSTQPSLTYSNPQQQALNAVGKLTNIASRFAPQISQPLSIASMLSKHAASMMPSNLNINGVTEQMFSGQPESGASEGAEPTSPTAATTSSPGSTGENQFASVYDNSGMTETVDDIAQISPQFLASILQGRNAQTPLLANQTYTSEGEEEKPILLDYVRSQLGFL